jgi:hypothetical protein
LSEYVREERWLASQLIAEKMKNEFTKFIEFDNSIDLNESDEFEKIKKEEDISLIYELTNLFFDMDVQNEIAEQWLIKNRAKNINRLFEDVTLKVNMGENYVSKNKTNRKTTLTENKDCTCGNTKTSIGRFSGFPRKKNQRILDNLCPSCQLRAKEGRVDDVRDGDIAANTKYTFRTYHEGKSTEPTITRSPEAKETKFQQDADKIKAKRQKANNAEAGKVMKVSGLSPEYDTRGSGTVYPMSGLGMVTYREQKETKYTSTAEVSHKSFKNFRKEAIDSPSPDMGVTGTAHGPTNKEPMETLNKIETTPILKKKKK